MSHIRNVLYIHLGDFEIWNFDNAIKASIIKIRATQKPHLLNVKNYQKVACVLD